MAGKSQYNQQDLIKSLKEQWKYKYEYSPTLNFTSINNKLKGKCNKHNIEFITTYNKHKKYSPCKFCLSENLSQKLTYSKEKFISKSNQIHNNKYNYDNFEYINTKTESQVFCKVKDHGFFSIKPTNHIVDKRGCPKCVKENRSVKYSKEQKISILNKKHNNKYTYIIPEKSSVSTKIQIFCPKHGLFLQTFTAHRSGQSCPKCHNKYLSNPQKADILNNIHNNKYEYILDGEFKSKDKIKIKCIKHNINFEQKFNDHQQGHTGCSKCNNVYESVNNDLKNFIELHINKDKIEYNNRSLIKKEIDIYIPHLKLGIEFNGDYWHSHEMLKDRMYHLNKTRECNKQNIQLIHIWENDWLKKPEIIKSIILNKIGKTQNRIYARKCEIKEINYNESSRFLNENHLQGNCISKYRIGLYYNNELVSLMTFGKLRKNLNQTSKDNQFELIRFCNKLNTSVIGGASKLLKHFIKNNNPEKIISYANRDWSSGNMYNKLNFKFIKYTYPNYWYILNNNKINRFSLRKDILVKKGYDSELSESQIIAQIPNIKTIYNSGNIKYEYNSKQHI